MIIFLTIFTLGGWITAFWMMRQRNNQLEKNSETKSIFRNKVINDLGFKTYVDFSTNANWDTFEQEVMKRVYFVSTTEREK